MSMHRAKGLEFDHVFLPAFEDGVIPSAYGDPDEERRLAYVALTRGKRRVRSRGAIMGPVPASREPTTSESQPAPAEFAIADWRAEARQKGYVGDSCPDCGNFTFVRNGACLKCDACGSTTGCS